MESEPTTPMRDPASLPLDPQRQRNTPWLAKGGWGGHIPGTHPEQAAIRGRRHDSHAE